MSLDTRKEKPITFFEFVPISKLGREQNWYGRLYIICRNNQYKLQGSVNLYYFFKRVKNVFSKTEQKTILGFLSNDELWCVDLRTANGEGFMLSKKEEALLEKLIKILSVEVKKYNSIINDVIKTISNEKNANLILEQ